MQTKTSQSSARADEPINSTSEDALGFVERYAVPLARQIVSTSRSESLTIGIYGPWGSGKTSLMNIIECLVSGQESADSLRVDQSSTTVRCTAWKYAQEESLWRVLVKVILDELLKHKDEHDDEKHILRDTLYEDVTRTKKRLKVNWPRLAAGVVSLTSLVISSLLTARNVPTSVPVQVTLAGVALGGAAITAFGVTWLSKDQSSEGQPKISDKLGSEVKDLAQAFEIVEDVLSTHHRVEYIEQFAESFEQIVKRFLLGKRLVVFIDDLDRCLPDKAVQVLEGIKLFLGVPNTVFVLGVDVNALAYAIEAYYAHQYATNQPVRPLPISMNGIRYLEKVVQLPFHLPTMEESDIAGTKLMEQLCDTKEDRQWLEIGIRGFGGNPRAVKRFARIYRNRVEVMSAGSGEILKTQRLHLAKLVVLQEHPQWNEVVDLIVSYTVSKPVDLLREGPLALLEKAAIAPDERQKLLDSVDSGSVVMSRLAKLVTDESLMRFLRTAPRYSDETPIDPLPLIRLSGSIPSTSEMSSGTLGFEDIVSNLVSSDRPARAQAISAVRELPPQSRRRILERLFALAAGQSEASNPDSAGLPLTVQAISSLHEHGIEQELMFERAEWLSTISTRLVETSGKTTESQDALLNLIAQLEQGPGTLAPPVSPDRVEGQSGLDDSPIRTDTDDALGFYSHVKALGRVIDGSTTPLTVGIFGPWGSGKTSFLRMMQEYVAEEGQYKTIWINAWGTSATPLELLVEGLGTIFTGSRKVEDLHGSLQRKLDVQDVRADIADLVTSLTPPDKRIAVFIDDLDRCAPDRQVEFLEMIAGAFNVNPLVTVIAADRDVLLQTVRPRYRDLLETSGEELKEDIGEDFLEKVIDISFMIPVSDSRTALAMMGGLQTEETSRTLQRLVYYLDPNPRKLKRFVNTYRLVLVLAREKNPDLDQGDEELLARLTLLGSRWPALLGDPVRLVKLWRASSDHDVDQRSAALNSAIDELKVLDTEALIAFLEQEPPPSEQQVEMALPLLRRAMPIPPAR